LLDRFFSHSLSLGRHSFGKSRHSFSFAWFCLPFVRFWLPNDFLAIYANFRFHAMMTLTTKEPIASPAPAFVPEFFRLPRTGERDAYFGNSRSLYYLWDRLGLIRLVHLRERGKTRGCTFVPYAEVAARIRAAQQEAGEMAAKDGGGK
jgi:hypothetical protein